MLQLAQMLRLKQLTQHSAQYILTHFRRVIRSSSFVQSGMTPTDLVMLALDAAHFTV
jgi:BTB And C-terminal Kelch